MSEGQSKAMEPRRTPREVIRLTLTAALVPGAGHLLFGQKRTGALLGAVTLMGIALAATQLVSGLFIFESSLGAFIFRALLRGIALIYAFSALDIYLCATRPQDQEGPTQRLAILLNLLIPGTGYLVVKAWIRTATGLALLTLILVFADAGTHRYLDIIFIVMQVVMGVAVYHHIYLQKRAASEEVLAPVSHPVPAAQIVILGVMTLAAIGFGAVVLRSLPDNSLVPLTLKEIRAEMTSRGLRFSVARLGLTMTTMGDEWQTLPPHPLVDFAAVIKDKAFVRLVRRPLPPFIRPEGQLKLLPSLLRQEFEGQGLIHQKTIQLTLHGAPAVQLRFSGDKTQAHRGDFWAVAIPRERFAFVMMLFCQRDACEEIAPLLEQTRDSFKLDR